jgi:diadenosine tetraphosphate (Ap4A) HIT family hydrolase
VFGTAQSGWLVVLPRRHVLALDEMSHAEAAALGPLLRAVTAALREVTGCAKTYVALFAEAEGFGHVHFHVVPAPPAWTRSCAARGYSRCWAATPPGTCPTATWTS